MSFDYKGFFHIHSAFSHDGTTDIRSIIQSAQKCGADFIIITDHFNMDSQKEGYEGYHGNLLVIAGEEISPYYNHYLAIGIKEPVCAEPYENPQIYIDAVKKQNAAGLIAHPDHTGTVKFGVRSYAWNDWNVTGYDAISIWDFMTDWQSKLTSYVKAFFAFSFPSFALSGPKRETLARWDTLNQASKSDKLIAGYGEIDNHNTKKKIFGLTFNIFPFDYSFKTVSTHILPEKELSKDAREAKQQVIECVKNSKLYVAQESWDEAKGFELHITDGANTAYSGGAISLSQNLTLKVKLPKKAHIKIVLNGKTIAEKNAGFFELRITEKGVYRVEAYKKKCFIAKPWIFSNHIKVR